MKKVHANNSQYRAYSVLVASTVAFTVCFMVWMMYAVLGIPVKKELGLNELQFGILTAIPVLSGSLVRVPLGIWTDRFGGRLVMSCLMLSTVVPIFMAQFATVYWQFLVIGLFVGLAGGSFWWARLMWRVGFLETNKVWQWGFLVLAMRGLSSVA